MTDSRHVEERISIWFDQVETVSRFPDPLLRATFEHTRGLRQARSSSWRTFPMFRNFAALAATGAAAVILAITGVALTQNVPGQVGGAPAFPTPSQTPAAGQMWPQSSLEEVRQAQAAADAADPDHTWQLDPEIANGNSPTAEIVDRFIHEVIGWEEYVFNPFVGWDAAESNLNYLKCAPGEVNLTYPQDEFRGHCAPTIDQFTYETLIVDLAQPVRSDPSGIWVVLRWRMGPPFAQVDPAAAEARATARLEEFLQARIAGQGAEGYVDVGGWRGGTLAEVPLLYSARSGAPYERYEIDAVGGPHWPYGDMEFDVRLFADGGETVVEQPFRWGDSRLYHDAKETKENGQPVGLAFAFLDGQVLLTAALPWVGGFERDSLDLGDRYYGDPGTEAAIVLVRDPLPGCAIGRAAADSDALASSLESDPALQASAPVTVNLGGVDGVAMDVTLAPGASRCAVLRLADGSDRRGVNLVRGSQARLYLFDMPKGSSMRILAIAVVAPEARFDAVIEAATPVMDSIEFPARGGDQ